jgi:hypothetical protein
MVLNTFVLEFDDDGLESCVIYSEGTRTSLQFLIA